jgi:carbon monoxide dehydrogenase subunit G
MKITGERVLPVPIDVVWASLFDPVILRQCIPGCESVVKESDALYKATTVMSIGPLRAKFSGTLAIADAHAPTGCTLIFEGAGGAAGLAKGSAAVSLQESEGGTKLIYEADAQISGKLAQVGSRLIDSVARKLSAEFFDKFETAVSVVQSNGQPLPGRPQDSVV